MYKKYRLSAFVIKKLQDLLYANPKGISQPITPFMVASPYTLNNLFTLGNRVKLQRALVHAQKDKGAVAVLQVKRDNYFSKISNRSVHLS